MNVKSINVVPINKFPERKRNTKYDEVLKDIVKQAHALKDGTGVVVTLEGKSFQPLMTKLKAALDPKKYELYRSKNEVAIAKLPAKG